MAAFGPKRTRRSAIAAAAFGGKAAAPLIRSVAANDPQRRAAPSRAKTSADPRLINPTTGIVGCCACPASDQAAIAPPSAAMNFRLAKLIAIGPSGEGQ